MVETGIKVSDCMRSPLICISADASIEEAARKMREERIGSLVILEGTKPWGIVTTTDIVYRGVAEGRGGKGKVRELASTPLITINPDVDIVEAAKLMRDKGVKRLIVLRGDEPIGIVSQRDIIRISPSLYDLIAERKHYGKTMLFPGR